MGLVDCLRCINSACCKLKVEVDRNEYNRLVNIGLKNKLETYTDIFLKQNTKYKNHRNELDKLHNSLFAKIKKNDKGYCVLLDKDMNCSIYNDRPQVCKDYKHNRCKNIRKLKD